MNPPRADPTCSDAP